MGLCLLLRSKVAMIKGVWGQTTGIVRSIHIYGTVLLCGLDCLNLKEKTNKQMERRETYLIGDCHIPLRGSSWWYVYIYICVHPFGVGLHDKWLSILNLCGLRYIK